MKRRALATMFGLGLLRGMPGTYGSLVAVLIAYPILLLPMGYCWLALGSLLITLVGTRQSTRYMRDRSTAHDPKEIVIDEWAGQWITFSVWHGWLWLIAGSGDAAERLLSETAASPLYLALGFVLFRLFDIVKPWPISLADRRIKGGFGVMFDDVLAGLFAGTLLYAAYIFSPLVTGSLAVHP
jgi:phosphatidylglycerophosphatase A